MAESILWEIAENRKKPVMALSHWLAILSPTPPGAAKMASWLTSKGTSGGAATLIAQDDVYIPTALPEATASETHVPVEQKRTGKAPMELLVSTRVPPNELVPLTVFREQTPVAAQALVVEDEPELLILTQLLESLYTEDSRGEKRKRPVPS